MDGRVGIIALLCLSIVAAELVYLHDTNNDHEKRNLDFGLAENLQFRMVHFGNEVTLNLKENKRLNANAPIYEPFTDSLGNTRAVRNLDIEPNNKVRYYQDIANGAYMTIECMKRENGPCTRILTGNLVLNGQEYKLEPAMDEMAKRELPTHLGTPHTIEALTNPFYLGGISDHPHGGKVVTAHVRELIDYVTHPPITTMSTTTEDMDAMETPEELEEERREANKFLLERLLKRLNRQKRQSTPVAHGIEMLVAIDHAVYDEFATRFSGDEQIKYKIREYYTQVMNGVDIRYASIQEDDISIYVVISGFFISNSVATSPWMDYSQNPTDGSAGLSYMVTWRQTPGLPTHDHSCLITGTNIQSGGSSGVVGIAYLDGVCNNYRVSIQEEYGFFKGSGVLAHELGHNLGAYHDTGATGSGCHQDDDYVMAPYVSSVSAGSENIEPWRFSTCSIDYFRDYLQGLGTRDCTLNRGTVWNQTEYEKHTAGLAGQLYSEEEQCILLYGVGSTFKTFNRNSPDVCRNLQCTNPSNSDYYRRFVAAHGTPCGEGMICFEGLCVEDETGGTTSGPTTSEPSSPTTPTTVTPSPSFYECADTGHVGMSCPDIRTLMGTKLKMCKRFFGECCQFCYAKKTCKKDKPVAGAKKYQCSELVETLGMETTCTLFPYFCCKTCESIAL